MTAELVRAVQALGPCTAAEVAAHLGWKVERVRIRLAAMRDPGPGQVVHVSHWERVSSGVGSKAYYKAGHGENAPRPTYDSDDDSAACFYKQSTIGVELQSIWNQYPPQQPEKFYV